VCRLSGTLTASVNQQDLANSVGSVREVVAGVLAELRSEHLVRTSPGCVEILDRYA
jgi:CRP/FNR family transcriptional regulator